jgi:hypothetical protein
LDGWYDVSWSRLLGRHQFVAEEKVIFNMQE